MVRAFFLDFWYRNLQPPRRSLDGYKHIVDVEYYPPVLSKCPHFPPEAAKAKEAAQKEPSMQKTEEYHEIMEGIYSIFNEVSDSIIVIIS